MEQERLLYNKLVDVLLSKLNDPDISSKDLDIIVTFLKNNNIQATLSNKGLAELNKEILSLPFDDLDIYPEKLN